MSDVLRGGRGVAAVAIALAGLTGSARGQAVEIRGHYAVAGVTHSFGVEYAKVEQQPLACDIFLPAARPEGQRLPLVVFIHGGAWMTGLRIDIPRELIALAERGFAVATIDYRPSRFDRFPANVHDVRAAVRFLRARADDYGIDPDRIALVGFGSGGHLALMAALAGPALDGTVGDHDEVSSAIQAVVSFHGPTNIQTICLQKTPGGVGRHRPAVELMLGGPPERLTDAAKLASPVSHVRGDAPPILLVHGDLDDQVPLAQALELEAACRRKGSSVELVVLEGHGHRHLRVFGADRSEPMERFLRQRLPLAAAR